MLGNVVFSSPLCACTPVLSAQPHQEGIESFPLDHRQYTGQVIEGLLRHPTGRNKCFQPEVGIKPVSSCFRGKPGTLWALCACFCVNVADGLWWPALSTFFMEAQERTEIHFCSPSLPCQTERGAEAVQLSHLPLQQKWTAVPILEVFQDLALADLVWSWWSSCFKQAGVDERQTFLQLAFLGSPGTKSAEARWHHLWAWATAGP